VRGSLRYSLRSSLQAARRNRGANRRVDAGECVLSGQWPRRVEAAPTSPTLVSTLKPFSVSVLLL